MGRLKEETKKELTGQTINDADLNDATGASMLSSAISALEMLSRYMNKTKQVNDYTKVKNMQNVLEKIDLK
jgi:hypothetical protein